MALPGKTQCAGRHDASHHGSRVTSALEVLDRAQRRFLATHQLDIVDVDSQFPAARHSSLGLSLCNRRVSKPSFWNDQSSVDADILQDFEVDGISDMAIR